MKDDREKCLLNVGNWEWIHHGSPPSDALVQKYKEKRKKYEADVAKYVAEHGEPPPAPRIRGLPVEVDDEIVETPPPRPGQ